MDYELFGWLGLLLIHGSRIPQLIHMLASKRATGLSLSGTAAIEAGLASYLVYAIVRHDRVFIASNLIGFALQGFVLYLNWLWRERKQPIATSDGDFYWREGKLHRGRP